MGVVVNCLDHKRRSTDVAVRNKIDAAFDACLPWAATRKSPPPLHRSPGAGSDRWALTAGLRPSQSTLPAARGVR